MIALREPPATRFECWLIGATAPALEITVGNVVTITRPQRPLVIISHDRIPQILRFLIATFEAHGHNRCEVGKMFYEDLIYALEEADRG